jgi:hypothetical protein
MRRRPGAAVSAEVGGFPAINTEERAISAARRHSEKRAGREFRQSSDVLSVAGFTSLIALALAMIPDWLMRSWRTAALLIGAAVGVLVVDLSGMQPRPILDVAFVTVAAVAILRGYWWLWAMRVEDHQFVEAFGKVREEIGELKSRIDETDPHTYVRTFDELIDRLDDIEAPAADWDDLRRETADELRRRSRMMRGQTAPVSYDLQQADAHWLELEARFTELVRAKTSFWLLMP